MNYEIIKNMAAGYRADMSAFLRELIALPGDSGQEEARARRILAEMERLEFDDVSIDRHGNVTGIVGTGERTIAFDGHIDTASPGRMDNWSFDPREGMETDEEIGGRGASAQLGGIVSAIYGAKIMKTLQLIPEGYRIMVVGTVQKESCDGLCWQYIYHRGNVFPEFVVLTEPTDGGIYLGHRGRMEIRLDIKGTACHGSAPERGDNAIFKMAEILSDVAALNDNPADHPDIPGLVRMLDEENNPHAQDARFIGRGTVTVSEIRSGSPSGSSVADECSIILNRHMTAGESFESSMVEILNLPACQKYAQDVTISVHKYAHRSWTGMACETDCYFPAWLSPEPAPHVQAFVQTHKAMFGDARMGQADSMPPRTDRPLVDKWSLSTNGVSIQGLYGIPCVGYGPGSERMAHVADEITWKQDLAVAAALYAAVPLEYTALTRITSLTLPDDTHPGFFRRLFSKFSKKKRK